MNVLLLYPEIPETFWSFKHAVKFLRKKASLPPLGLLTVAAMLPRQWPKRLRDLNITPLADQDLAWADLALISAMAVQRQSASQLIARCQAHGLPVVAGGPLFSCEPEAFSQVEHLVLGEAELTLPAFLADLARGQARHCYRAEGFAELGRSPMPLWELLDLDQYASMSVQFSRGCPFQCDFCNVTTLFGHQPRHKEAGQIVAELDALYARGWRASVFFADDNFIANKGYLKNLLLPALIRWRRNKKGISFYTETSINLADDPELMELMTAAGFDTVFIGIETPAESSLAECHKSQNRNRDLVANVRTIQRHGLQVQGGFIVGFDNDTPATFRQHLEFIKNSGIVVAMVGLLQAPPGTRLYQRLKEAGRLLAPAMSGDNLDGTTNIVPRMGLEPLKEGYRNLLTNLYAPAEYYQRIRVFFSQYRPGRRERLLAPGYAMAFVRSIYHLGIRGRERLCYWRLLAWTAFHSPALFPLAIKLAIFGHHFRRICEQQS